MQFVFPPDIEDYQFVPSKVGLSQLLVNDALKANLVSLAKYSVKNPMPRYLYAKCRLCKA